MATVSCPCSLGLLPCSLYLSSAAKGSLSSSRANAPGAWTAGFIPGPSASEPLWTACHCDRALIKDLANLRGPTLHKVPCQLTISVHGGGVSQQ